MRANRRPGNVAVLTALLLTSLIGLVGLAIEGGMMMAERRRLQTAADSAAMAAACAMYNAYPNSSPNPKGTAANAARDMVIANGIATSSWTMAPAWADVYSGGVYSQAGGTGNMQVRFGSAVNGTYGSSSNSPNYGEGALNAGTVEVIITYYQSRYFTQIWGSSTIPITARAVAKGAWVAPKDGVIILGSGKGTLNASGQGSMTVNGGDIVVNSDNGQAVVISGQGEIYSNKSMYITGGTSDESDINVVSIFEGQQPTPDPYAYLPVPTVTNSATYTTKTVSSGGKKGSSFTFHVIKPGIISSSTGLPKVFNNGDVIVFDGDGQANPVFWFNYDFKAAGAEFIGMGTTDNSVNTTNTTGILIYNNSGSFEFTGGDNTAGNFIPGHASNLSSIPDVKAIQGHQSGIYKGLSFWQASSNSNNIKITGQADFGIGGTVYAPSATLDMSGQGTASGAQFVVNKMDFTGQGNLTVDYNSGTVAKTRVLRLLE